MAFITLDFETYYDKDLGFKTQTNEEYLNDPRFEVIGVAVRVDEEPTRWFSGTDEETGNWLRQFDWEESALLCHNAMFDGAILSWRYGIVPKMYYDTLCMARAVHGTEVGNSLAKLAEYYGIGVKGTEVVNAFGKSRANFSWEMLARYGEYCKNDVDLTYELFWRLAPRLQESEHKLIDMTLRMYTQPVLHLNDAVLLERLEEVQAEKSKMLAGLMSKLGVDSEEAVRAKLASNPQFARVLEDFGVKPPMKVSPTTGKDTYALAKNDLGFIALTEHEDPIIQQLCAVRLGTKSTIEESRITRFIDTGARNKGLLPVPLKYYGAHTGRWSGQDGVNLQNLPSRDKKKKALKNAIQAPHDHYIVNCDSSQIEARVLAWLAGQQDVVEAFAQKRDIYCEDATVVFGRKITKADTVERFVGKTCLGADTRVLTRRGWVPILDVALTDQLWDGVEWVQHQGVSFMGLKPTIWLSGLELTTDHEILTAHTKWETAQDVLTHEAVFQSALDLATSSLSGMENTIPYAQGFVGAGTRFADALAAGVNTLMRGITLERDGQPHVTPAPNARQAKKDGGNTSQSYLTTPIAAGCSVDWPLPLLAAIAETTTTSAITVKEASTYLRNGGKTALRSLNIFRQYRAGTTPAGKWIASTIQKGMSRGIFGSLRLKRTRTTEELSSSLRPVFDILNSGSRNRFTVLTERGPLIVHNCRLGLGYGTGAAKLQHTLETTPPGAKLALDECKGLVNTWRSNNPYITALWREADQALEDLMSWPTGKMPYWLGKQAAVLVTHDGLVLPNQCKIRYKNLRRSDGKIVYDGRKGMETIWGGTVVENVVQALARIIVGEQMIKMSKKYRPVLTVHDAAVILAPKPLIEDAIAYVTKVMSTPPDWCATLPVACEAKYGETYGEC